MAQTMKQAISTPEEKKLDYVNTQIEEMGAIIRRNEVDIYIIDNVEQEDKAEIKRAEAQRDLYVTTNEQLVKAIKALTALKAELEA